MSKKRRHTVKLPEITFGFCDDGEWNGYFGESLLECAQKSWYRGYIRMQSGPRIAAARNGIVDLFLERSPAKYLLMVDSDMAFMPEAVELLLAHADDDRVVGGLCFSGTDSEIKPTLYEFYADENDHFASRPIWNYPTDALVEVDATGAAFLLIPRVLLEKMRAEFSDKTAYPYFAETERDLKNVGEDITFCLRLRSLGFRVFVHTGANVGHVKSMVLDQGSYLAWRKAYTAAHDGEEHP